VLPEGRRSVDQRRASQGEAETQTQVPLGTGEIPQVAKKKAAKPKGKAKAKAKGKKGGRKAED
jgi:hypothetical protein